MFSLFSRRVARSGSSSEPSSAGTRSSSNMSEGAATVLTLSGPTSSGLSGPLAEQPQTKRLVVEAAINRLFSERFFSICTLDSVLDTLQVSQKSDAYRLLRTLHCVDYCTMSPELREKLPHLVREALTPVTATLAAEIALRNFDFGD